MSTIRDLGSKIKPFWESVKENLLLVVIIILVALFAFGLGRMSVIYGTKDELRIVYPEGQQPSP